MKTLFQDQEEFMKAGDVTCNSTDTSDEDLAIALIEEEFEEFMDESLFLPQKDIRGVKECLDLIYVCAQYMNTVVGSENAQKLWDIVHTHNMSKCQEGKLVKREDGKVLKPENFDKDAWKKEFNTVLNLESYECKKKAIKDIKEWAYVIDRHYQEGEHTYGPCNTPNCSKSARGGYYCASCAEAKLAVIVGTELAAKYGQGAAHRHGGVKRYEAWEKMMETVYDK